MANIKELSKYPNKFSGGHRLCAGCGAGIVARQAMMAVGNRKVVVTNATGCLEVATTIFPYTAWEIPWFHSAFENAAASGSGVEAAYRSFKKQGKIKDDVYFITFGGDGGTYDIGFQALSGAMERGHRMLYICYDNQAYMNTGIQRSSATPKGANTTTAPAGKVISGKQQHRKDIAQIMVAHDIPYVAQSVVGLWNDFITKVQKALDTDGPSFINILQPCRLGWGYPPEITVELGKLAAETGLYPCYEVVNGEYKITFEPKERKPIIEWIKPQARFKHLLKPENKHIIDELQVEVDRKWNKILKLAGKA